MILDSDIYSKIEMLSENGNALLEKGDWQGAVGKWNDALALVPLPKSDWDAATWLYASIGDALFFGGDFDGAKEALFDALNCPDGIENPFIHYRLGQALIHLGDREQGVKQLLQAYMLDGEQIFLNDEAGNHYLSILQDQGLIS